MSVLWQTGEPPEKTDLLIRMRWPGREEVCRYFADKCDGVWYVDGMEARGIEVLAWSTLDAAPDVLGRLEALLNAESCPWVCLEKTVCNDSYEATRYDDDGNERKVNAPTLAAAIEQLCGGTDEDT